jgi:competence protein ComEC
MKRTVVPMLILMAVIVLVVSFFWLALKDITIRPQSSGLLEVSFLNVGQGDATFIESPSGMQVLIDGGRNDRAVLRELPKVMGFFDRSIDMIVATHPDSDHIGGLIDVLKRYDVDTILMTNNEGDSPAYDAFMEAVQNEGALVREVKRGEVYDLGVGGGGSTTLTILFPDRDVRTLENNTSSIVAQLSYGDFDVLLTGDSPQAIERYLVELDGTALRSEVLKVGHHGSRTSTDSQFLEMVKPKYGIISAGKDNDYGHPHKEVMETLSLYNVESLNTADVGTIILESNGAELWFRE